MEKALINRLLSAVSFTMLVGDKIFWGRAPQGTKPPYVTLQVISAPRNYTFQGPSGYVASRVQLDAYCLTYLQCRDVIKASEHTLSGHRGGIFQGIFVDGERDFTAPDAGEVNQLFRKSLDLIVHHST